MQKSLSILIAPLAFLTQSSYAATCGSLTNNLTTMNTQSYWLASTSYVMQNDMDGTNALSYCHQQAGGNQYCGSTVKNAPCYQFIQANVSNLPSSLSTYWCCTTQATLDALNSTSSGGNDNNTEDKKYIVLECPISSMSDCNTACATMMPQLFGTPIATVSNGLSAVMMCSALETTTNATYCCLSKDLVDANSPLRLTCPANTISPIYKTKRTFALTQKTKTSGSSTLTYYEVSKPAAAYCICEPDYYGPVIDRLKTSTATCTKCPCTNVTSSEKCGTVYNMSDLSNSDFVYGVLSGNLNISTITACKIRCTEADNCSDTTGTYYHTNYCAYSES